MRAGIGLRNLISAEEDDDAEKREEERGNKGR